RGRARCPAWVLPAAVQALDAGPGPDRVTLARGGGKSPLRPVPPLGELGDRPFLEVLVEVDIDLLVVERDQSGNLLRLGEGGVISPEDVLVVLGLHRCCTVASLAP